MEIKETVIELESSTETAREICEYVQSRVGKVVVYRGDNFTGNLEPRFMFDNEHVEVIAEMKTEIVSIAPPLFLYQEARMLCMAIKYTFTTESGKQATGYMFWGS
jgi:hypothetical protein